MNDEKIYSLFSDKVLGTKYMFYFITNILNFREWYWSFYIYYWIKDLKDMNILILESTANAKKRELKWGWALQTESNVITY